MGGVVFWILLAAALVILEVSTTQLVPIWFAAGALLAAFASLAGAPLPIQLVVFIVCSVVSFVAVRPILIEKVMPKRLESSPERIIGQTGIVREEIDNDREAGRVDADGLSWAARSEDGKPISVGTRVRVGRLEGVRLIVSPMQEQENSPGEAGGASASDSPNNESEV